MLACRNAYPVVFVQSDLVRDPYRGVERCLAQQGVRSVRIFPDQPPPDLAEGSRVVVVTEWRSAMSRQLLRQARDRGLFTVVLLDDARPESLRPRDGSNLPDVLHALRDELDDRIRIASPHADLVAHLESEGFHATHLPTDEAARADMLARLARECIAEVGSALLATPAPAPFFPKNRRLEPSAARSLLNRMKTAPRRAPSPRPVVVNCVVIEDSPVGGVHTWAQRLARGFADLDLPYHVRTLLIATRPDAWDEFSPDLHLDDLTDVCLVDPSMDQIACLECVVDSIRRVAGAPRLDDEQPGSPTTSAAPAIIAPNYSDITYAAAAQLRALGSRTLAIAHTDDDYYRSLIRAYAPPNAPLDAAVGVSRACSEWLAPIADPARAPLSTIVYGVPVAAAPRTPATHGPLQLAYIGRMVQTQKRIRDLLILADELERLAVPFVLHMIGDGADLPAWRAAWETRMPRSGRVEFHGRRDPAWVERFLPSIDFSVLVSEFEGTSISMLESMGAGVIPAVTAVSSGVDEWVIDGVTGCTAPVGDPARLARRIAELSRDRAGLAAIARAAWARVRDAISIETMCRQYASLFDRMLALDNHTSNATPWTIDPSASVSRPTLQRTPNESRSNSPARLNARRSDVGVRLHESWRWPRQTCEDPRAAKASLSTMLARLGYRRVAWNIPSPGCDFLVIDAERQPMTPTLARQMEHWRAQGLGVATWPHLIVSNTNDDARDRTASATERLTRAARAAVADGCRRLVIYGVGKHTRRIPSVFNEDFPFVGFMDDQLPPWEYMFGLPVVPAAAVMQTLAPDAVILSSDAWEQTMWHRTAPLREAGVKIYPLYAEYADAVASHTTAQALAPAS